VVVRGDRDVVGEMDLTGGTLSLELFLDDFFSFFSFRLPLLFFSFLLSFFGCFLSITVYVRVNKKNILLIILFKIQKYIKNHFNFVLKTLS
jgi:hypothetical protein